MVSLARFERVTDGLEGRCSIQLSYRRTPQDGFPGTPWRFQGKACLSADRIELYHRGRNVSTGRNAPAGKKALTNPPGSSKMF